MAPSFKRHSVHAKKSIHIPMRIQGINSTALIDCGATDSFINRAFMKKRGFMPIPLEHPRVCMLGEGTTDFTHGFKAEMEVGNRKVEMDFLVMNDKSSQGLVLRYYFLSKHDATTNFKSRELHLGGMNVHCLSTQFEGTIEQ